MQIADKEAKLPSQLESPSWEHIDLCEQQEREDSKQIEYVVVIVVWMLEQRSGCVH